MALLPDLLLFMHPTKPASPTPLFDRLTRKMAAALRCSTVADGGYRGVHVCICGAESTSCNYRLPNGETTNALCVHYLAHHRSEVARDQLLRVEHLDCGEVEPTRRECQGPEIVFERIRSEIQASLGHDCLGIWVKWGLDVTALCRALPTGHWPEFPGYLVGKDAHALWLLLWNFRTKDLALIQQTLEENHQDPRDWGKLALSLPYWKRMAWVELIDKLVQYPRKDDNRSISPPEALAAEILDGFPFQWPEDGEAIPTLLEIAKRSRNVRDQVIDNLEQLSRIAGLLISESAVSALQAMSYEHTADPQFRQAVERLLDCVQRSGRDDLT